MTSICIYGSVARRNQDALSDKDALIIFDNSDECRIQINNWKSRGWSVATYTESRLKKMAGAGSLFVQHLKQEGLIVSDNNHVLENILNGYTPKPDYSDDMALSAQALRLLEHVPDGLLLQYWSADLLHILIRNLSLLRLANAGIYEFSLATIAKQLKAIKVISTDDLWVFAELRKAKTFYRSRKLPLLPIPHVIEAALRVIEKICGVVLQRTNGISFSYVACEQSYFTIREIEKYLLILNPAYWIDGARSSEEMKLWKIITDPRAYSWVIKCKKDELVEMLRQIEVLSVYSGRTLHRIDIPSTLVSTISSKLC